MNFVETTLIFAGIPAGATGLLALAVYGRAELHQQNRYRPGRPWLFEPVWYLPYPDHVAAVGGGTRVEHRAIEQAERPAPTPAAVGGASGEW